MATARVDPIFFMRERFCSFTFSLSGSGQKEEDWEYQKHATVRTVGSERQNFEHETKCAGLCCRPRNRQKGAISELHLLTADDSDASGHGALKRKFDRLGVNQLPGRIRSSTRIESLLERRAFVYCTLFARQNHVIRPLLLTESEAQLRGCPIARPLSREAALPTAVGALILPPPPPNLGENYPMGPTSVTNVILQVLVTCVFISKVTLSTEL